MPAHKLTALAAVVVTTLLRSPSAEAEGPAARALDVSLAREGEHTYVVVLLDSAVPVVEHTVPARVSFRLARTRASGRRRPSIEPDADGPVAHVALLPEGPDLELLILVRRPVAVRHWIAKTPEGVELRVDLADTPSARAHPFESPPAGPPAPGPPSPGPSPPAPALGPPAPAPSPAARAPTPPVATPPAPPAEQGRVLGGHVFLTPAGFASPFVDTRLGLTLGFAHAAFPAVDARSGARYGAQLGALSLRADLAVRLSSRLGLLASGGGAATLGIDAPSALNLGASGGGAWMLGLQGVAARLPRTGTQVAATLAAEGSAGGRIGSLVRVFDQAIATKQVPSFSALGGPLASTTGRFQWTAAQAIGPHASAQASLGWAGTWTSTSAAPTEHALDVTGGVALTVNAAPRVPLSILVEYDGDAILFRSGARSTAPSELLSARGTSGAVLGIYYSGRRDLLLGALGGATTRGDGPAHTSQQASLTMDYFF